MKLLALESSSEACSVALLSVSGKAAPELYQRFELAPRQHTQRILPMVEQLLAEHEISLQQLDAIGFGRGPGSFTGLRICLGAVQGLAYGADLPVVGVSTLAAQVQELARREPAWRQANARIISTLDARMDEVYWGVYQYGERGVALLGEERLTAPEQLLLATPGANAVVEHEGPEVVIGAGLNYAQRIPQLQPSCEQRMELLPTAAAVAELACIDFQRGLGCAADQALPVYLRDEVAWQKQPPAV